MTVLETWTLSSQEPSIQTDASSHTNSTDTHTLGARVCTREHDIGVPGAQMLDTLLRHPYKVPTTFLQCPNDVPPIPTLCKVTPLKELGLIHSKRQHYIHTLPLINP